MFDQAFWSWMFDTGIWVVTALTVATLVLYLIYKRTEPTEKTENPPTWLPEFPELPGSPSQQNTSEEAPDFNEELESENEHLEELLRNGKETEDQPKLSKKEQFLLQLLKTGKGKVLVKALDKNFKAFGLKWETDIEIQKREEEISPPSMPEPIKPEDPDTIPENERKKTTQEAET